MQGVGVYGPGVGPEQQQLLLHHPPALPLPPHGTQLLLRPGLLPGAVRGITNQQHSVVTPSLVRAEGEAGGAGRAQPAAVPGGGGRHRPAPSCRHEGASVGRGARQGGAGRQPLQLQHRFVELKVIVNFQHYYKTSI